ncbi:hypothetical protein [Mycobacterium sp.]|uniref:hypothetical protein n=1 Tax=Mycobacterium sp. TaxID=1785 RepID=UPI0031D3ECD9
MTDHRKGFRGDRGLHDARRDHQQLAVSLAANPANRTRLQPSTHRGQGARPLALTAWAA